jgi:hypothetical protein
MEEKTLNYAMILAMVVAKSFVIYRSGHKCISLS